MHLINTISQGFETPEDNTDPAIEDIGLLAPRAEEGHIVVKIDADIAQDETEHGVSTPALGLGGEGERAARGFPPATQTELCASAQTFAALVVTTAPAPACAAVPAPARSATPVPALAGVWTWRTAPAASSDEEM